MSEQSTGYFHIKCFFRGGRLDGKEMVQSFDASGKIEHHVAWLEHEYPNYRVAFFSRQSATSELWDRTLKTNLHERD